MHKLRFCLNPFVAVAVAGVVDVVVCAMTLISSKSDLFIEVKTEEGRENRVTETTGLGHFYLGFENHLYYIK